VLWAPQRASEGLHEGLRVDLWVRGSRSTRIAGFVPRRGGWVAHCDAHEGSHPASADSCRRGQLLVYWRRGRNAHTRGARNVRLHGHDHRLTESALRVAAPVAVSTMLIPERIRALAQRVG
jgi:hypothetical protein